MAEKVYKLRLEKSQVPEIKVSDNREIILSDGTKAFYSELEWTNPATHAQVVTVLVSAYKDGKWVFVVGHPWKEGADRGSLINTAINIVKTLKFK